MKVFNKIISKKKFNTVLELIGGEFESQQKRLGVEIYV